MDLVFILKSVRIVDISLKNNLSLFFKFYSEQNVDFHCFN
ncbi:hypothetical protein J699_01195 [Acinetobacter sp. 1000160]|nr:hypothetical protein J522_0423 [Acinetobacter baumannii 146457]EYT22580.1 hypothetical protein J699_01195 [Acinetobacter sp. 1000160]